MDKSQHTLNEDRSFLSKGVGNDNGKEELLVFKDPSDSGEDVQEAYEEQSVKTRMKKLLAQRRTALQSRNLNIPFESQKDTNMDHNDLKKKNTKTKSHAQQVKENPSNDTTSTIIVGSEDKSHSLKPIDEAKANDVAKENRVNQQSDSLSETQTSLGLDMSIASNGVNDSIASDVVDSYDEGDSSTKSAANVGQLMNHTNNHDFTPNVKDSESHLETLVEESETKESQEGEEVVQCPSEDIEREHGELISFFEYCASINSKSSSHEKDDLDNSDHLSPKSHSANDGSSMTPAASIQTFSVTSALTQKSHGSSSSPPSGITPTGSVQTFSLGGRSLTINSDPFKMSMFSPHFRSTEVYSSHENECESEPSFGGNTVVPDISVRDESHMFPSPTYHMLYASPTAKVNLSQAQDSPDVSVRSLLNELECQVEAVRSERTDSNKKISLSAKSADRILQMYASLRDKKSQTSTSQDNKALYSPVSRILAMGDSSGLSRAAASSLIERNKTLVKEVRFADQTCVELSERNLSLIREKEKLELELREVKAANAKLHRDVVESTQAFARIEERKKELEVKIIEDKERFDEQIRASNANLLEEKQRNTRLEEKLEKSLQLASHADSKLASIMAKYESMREEHKEAKETITSLRDRLNTVESTCELAASSAAEKYREAASDMQRKIEALHDCLEEKDVALRVERDARHKAEDEVQQWRETAEELEIKHISLHSKDGYNSPCRSQSSKKTTSSLVLARTLQFEVEKNCDVTERIIEAEKIIAVTQSKLRETEVELENARQEASDLRIKLNSHKRHSHSDFFDETSIASSKCYAENHLKKKLSCARSQCEEYKKELDLIIAQIKGIQSDNLAVDEISSKHNQPNAVLETVKELFDVCSKVNVVVSSRVNELEEKIQFLMNSMYQLHDLCKEEYSTVSGNSFNIEMMEEGATPTKGKGAVVRGGELSDQNNDESQLCRNEVIDSSRIESPTKFAYLRNKLFSLEEQLQAAMNEKISLSDAPQEAQDKINVLSSTLEESKTFSGKARRLEEERDSLEKSLVTLRSHAENLENKIKNLEEDNLFLFDDAVARGNELHGAKEKIKVLEDDADKLRSRVEDLEKEKDTMQEKLTNVDSQESILRKKSESYLEVLKEAEASRDQLQEEIQMLKSEAEDHVSMIHTLQESIASANEQNKELTQAYMKCNEELALVVETKARLEKSNVAMKSKVTTLETELSSNSQRIELMNTELEHLRTKLGTTEDAYDAMHEELVAMGSQVDTLHGINEEYERELSEAKKYIQGMEKNAAKLVHNIEYYEQLIKAKDYELNNANASIKASSEKITDLERQMSDTTRLHENDVRSKNDLLDQMKKHLDDAKNMLTEKEASYNELLSNNETQINSLTKQLTDLKDQYEAHLDKM